MHLESLLGDERLQHPYKWVSSPCSQRAKEKDEVN